MIKDENSMKLCEALWNEHEPHLRRLCNYKLSSYPSEIDDVIADAYLALCNAIDNNIEIKEPKKWLSGVVNNLIKIKYTEINKKKRLFVRFERAEYELLYDIDFDDLKVNDEMIEAIKDDVYDDLLPAEKALYTMVYHKKLKFKQIAKILNSTEDAVKQKHYRLKRKMMMLAKDKLDEI